MSVETIEKTKDRSGVVRAEEPTRKMPSQDNNAVGPDSATTAPASDSVGIPEGMPFKTKEQAAEVKRAAIRKQKRLRRKPAKAEPSVLGREPESLDTGDKPTCDKESAKLKNTSTEQSSPKQNLEQLTKAAKAKKPGAIDRLRDFLDKNPSVYRHYGDIAKAARYAFATLSSGDDDPVDCGKRYLRRSEEALKQYLPDDGCCQTERVLAEQVVVCSMRLNFFRRSKPCNHAVEHEIQSWSDYSSRSKNKAQNQLFKALSRLQTFRRLKSTPEQG